MLRNIKDTHLYCLDSHRRFKLKRRALDTKDTHIDEPPHVHIDKDAATAKVWLHDATVARSMGFSAQDLGKIQRMVKIHQSSFKEAWNAFFGT